MSGKKHLKLCGLILACTDMLARIIIDCTNVIVSDGRDTNAMSHAVELKQELHIASMAASNDYLSSRDAE